MTRKINADLLSALELMLRVYEDIVGAADGGSPYELVELTEGSFSKDAETARAAITKARGNT